MKTVIDTRGRGPAAGSNHQTRERYRDFAHTGPGTLAGRFMRMFWHPIYRSEDLLKGTAKPIRIMNEDFTLYRGEGGAVHLVGFRCRHRGAQLSVGWVEGDSIRCFYHGWMYNASGKCVQQPAEPKPFLDETPIGGYSAVDYLGLIFIYIGESEAPPLPRYEPFEDPNAHRMVTIDYRGFNFFQDFENGMDRVHGGFVHRTRPKSFDGVVDSPQVQAEEDTWGLRTYAQHPSGRHGVQAFGMPNKQHIKDTFSDRDNLIWKVPIDDEHTAHLRVTVVKGAEAIAKEKARLAKRALKPQLNGFQLAKEVLAGRLKAEDVDPETVEMVYFEDHIALLSQGVIADREAEFLGASDTPIVLLRNLWEREMRALAEGKPLKEWRYDAKEMETAIRRAE